MTLVLNGTTGVSAVDGSASTPAFQGNDTNTGMFFPAADTIAFSTAGTEDMRIDSSGNVGIGTSSPGAKLDVSGGVRVSANQEFSGSAYIYSYAGGSAGQVRVGHYLDGTNNVLQMITGQAERARIDSSGNLLVGATTTGYTDTRLVLSLDNSTKWVTGPGAGIATRFYVSASNSGGVYLNGTAATSWTAISDERFKTDLLPIENAATKVASLRAVTGVLKSDEDKTRKAFLMAQDVLAVLPEAVDTTNPDQLGLAYTEVIPLLVAAIQELTSRVQALEAKA